MVIHDRFRDLGRGSRGFKRGRRRGSFWIEYTWSRSRADFRAMQQKGEAAVVVSCWTERFLSSERTYRALEAEVYGENIFRDFHLAGTATMMEGLLSISEYGV
jgi:hypothetical protein